MIYMTMKVGEQPELHNKEIADTYELISTAVGGYIESLRLSDTCVLWINEEGKIDELPTNFYLVDRAGNKVDYVAGNVIFTGIDELGETVDLSEDDIELITKRFVNRVSLMFYA